MRELQLKTTVYREPDGTLRTVTSNKDLSTHLVVASVRQEPNEVVAGIGATNGWQASGLVGLLELYCYKMALFCTLLDDDLRDQFASALPEQVSKYPPDNFSHEAIVTASHLAEAALRASTDSIQPTLRPLAEREDVLHEIVTLVVASVMKMWSMFDPAWRVKADSQIWEACERVDAEFGL